MKPVLPINPISSDVLVDFLKTLYPSLSTAGSPPKQISSVCAIDSSDASESSLAFIKSKDAHQIRNTILSSRSGTFLLSQKAAQVSAPEGKWIIIVPDAQVAYVDILENFFLDRENSFLPTGIHSTATIDSSAKVSPDARIGAYVVIGANCIIESDVTLHPHVVLYHNVNIKNGATLHAHTVIREHCVIGQGCTIHAGAVIGSDGFGYIQDPRVGIRPVPQVGTVEISDQVDIGSNTCIDRATSGTTRIGKGSKLDNLVQIGHNVELGSNSIVCGQVGIGGSCKIGDGVVLGGQAGIGDHLKIASGVRIGGAGVVISNLEEPGDYMGYPVQPIFKWRRFLAAQFALPEFFKNLRKKKKDNCSP